MGRHIFKRQTQINVPVETLFAWHEQNGAIQRLTPPWAPMEMLSRKGRGVQAGVKVSFRLHLFKIPVIWDAEHIEYEKNRMFKDRQTRGPFARWIHTHGFIPLDEQRCVMEDMVDFKLPLGFLSSPFYGFAQKEFDRMFRYRHHVLKYDLENHVGTGPKKRILISGASGTIGSILVPFLRTCGHEVIRLVRNKSDLADNKLFWDPYQNILDLESQPRFDAVINLNGVDISRGRWTPEQKNKIMDSRVIPTRLLAKTISRLKRKPDVFISSSAIGFYGDKKGELLTENSKKGDSFISQVCDEWESASLAAHDAGIRTVQLRIGVVLTPAGGALKRMAPAFKAGFGVRLSHGRQFIPWISMEDTLSGILHILNHESINGPVNLTAPDPVTNSEFSKMLGRVFSRPVFFVMPEFLMKLLWGQMGLETLLASARVTPSKLLNSGFTFQHNTLLPALRTMLGR